MKDLNVEIINPQHKHGIIDSKVKIRNSSLSLLKNTRICAVCKWKRNNVLYMWEKGKMAAEDIAKI